MRKKWTRRFPKAKHQPILPTDRARLNENVERIRASNPGMSDAQSFWLAARQTNAYVPKPIMSDVTTSLAWNHLRRIYGGAHIAIETKPGGPYKIEVRREKNPICATGDSLGEVLSKATYGYFQWPPEPI